MALVTTTAARKHVEEIRRTKFSIGGKPNPLTEDLHQAVKNLSAELYAKDVHFLMELIQNAEDNEYPKGVDPSLEFVITSKDITNTGAPATLLVFNNEKGFSRKNIESICSVGRSTKKGLRKHGYIGEKGIGFKSVFLITSQPYIFSNGYYIKFNEKPCQHCNVGYIVPEWVEAHPILLSAIQTVYGSTTALPTTTLVLPLKPEKVKPVKDQLSSVHPEVLLFLSKIRRLSVREVNENPKHNSVSAISISSVKNFATSKSMDADSYTLHLTAGDGVDKECVYYMWKQRFPVKHENKVDARMEIDEWIITLAFPHGERLKRGSSSPGIYSFLPTETVTNFPFIIQADFLLASSRENILWDNKWNNGILDCVPVAFVNAFTSLVKSTEKAPVSSLLNMFRFLPVAYSSHIKLNQVRDAIREKLMKETIIPCESYTPKLFCKPNEVGRLNPAFWSILNKARSQGVRFSNISSHGAYLLASSFDKSEYNFFLNFLGIKYVDYEWYAKLIKSSDLVTVVSEDVYVNLLVFISENWGFFRYNTSLKNTPLIKYVGQDNNVEFDTPGTKKLMASDCDDISWLINWNTEFQFSTGRFFLPKVTQEAIRTCEKKQMLMTWLQEKANVNYVGVSQYALLLIPSLKSNRKLAVTFAHFLHNSLKKKLLKECEVQKLCSNMPIVDNHGKVTETRSGVLVPANGSKWVELIGPDIPWRQHDYFELGDVYTHSVTYFGKVTSGNEIVTFLKKYIEASDVPKLSPPNASIPTLYSPLTKSNTFLLLDWLRNLRTSGVNLPERFLSSLKNGGWLKISSNGSSGYRPPSESFMLKKSFGNLLQNGSVLVDIPFVDREFYGQKIKSYKDELRGIGVRFENAEACEFIGKRLVSLATSSQRTKDNVLSILKFIKYLGVQNVLTGELVKSVKEEKWVRTSCGDMPPRNCVIFSQEWNAAKQISDIPFIDEDYYGNEIVTFKRELDLLGVVVNFNQSYQLVVDNLKSSSSLTSLSSEAFLLILNCIRNLESSYKLIDAVKNTKCLKTNLGYKYPSESFLLNQESRCLLQVFGSFAVLDQQFYGRSILSMSNELKEIGVKVDFEDASKEFTRTFKQQSSQSSITKEHVVLFLQCYRKLKKLEIKFSVDFENCIWKTKWIRTRLGDYRSPNECILFSKDWESVSSISQLPFIDDNFYGKLIHDYRVELKEFGVVTDFKDGSKFVADGLFLPQDCSILTPGNVYSLLDSVKRLKETGNDLLDKFLEKVSQKKWLKTHFGYKCPNECMLFDPAWDSLLKRNDGPFIDEGFYGSQIGSYKKELHVLGVINGTNKKCRLLAGYLECHTNFETISRIYNFLSTFKWEPTDEDKKRIWIQKRSGNGEWVKPQDCVLHDKHKLFGEQFHVLDNFKYDSDVLQFFANTFNVKVHPSVEDYCKLWKLWESSGRQITLEECSTFWEFVVRNWYSRTEDTFKKNLSKVPVLDSDNSNRGCLSNKRDVFIGDDLFLTDLFKSCSRPIFVWCPQPSLKYLDRTKLLDIYKKLGVRTLSESVQKNVSDVDEAGFNPVNTREKVIKKGLVKLILGFLAEANRKIDPHKRHEAVSRLLAIKAFETPEKMTIRYRLSLSSGDVVDVEPRRMVRWDKQQSKLFMQKMEETCGRKFVMEYAFHFAEEIAEGVLWDNEEHVPDLSELIRSGYFVEFEEEAVDFLMKMKNLQMLVEDHDYLSSSFSSSTGNSQDICLGQTSRGKKRHGHNLMVSSSSNELRSTKSQKQGDTASLTPVTIIIPD